MTEMETGGGNPMAGEMSRRILHADLTAGTLE
jgi:hypothetical protein